MALEAVIFDLDETLLDTSALLAARDNRDWRAAFGRLSEVVPFAVREGEVEIASLPAECRKRGLPVGLLTHSPRQYATELMATHGIRVDEMVSGSDGYPAKPDASGLVAVARALSVPPEASIYVGDRVGDFGAAAAAEMASAGVSWSGRTPVSWRHGWPDYAFDRPSRLLEHVDGVEGHGPLGEVAAEEGTARLHWGSLLRLGEGTWGLGRYFPTGDRRHGGHRLSRLILAQKEDPKAQAELARIWAFGAEAADTDQIDLIASVPPSPDAGQDRFEATRPVLAEAFEAEDGGALLRQLYGEPNYKHTSRDARAALVVDRFEATRAMDGERVLLIDDVFTSGAQAQAARETLLGSGAGAVWILVAAVTQDSLPRACPECGDEFGGIRRIRRRRSDGGLFQGCSRYPVCRWSADLGD